MDEILPLSEIEARFPSEWVLLEDPETNEVQQVLAGKVRYHSKDRDEVYDKVMELRPKHFAVRYIGEFPEDEEIITRLLVGFDSEWFQPVERSGQDQETGPSC